MLLFRLTLLRRLDGGYVSLSNKWLTFTHKWLKGYRKGRESDKMDVIQGQKKAGERGWHPRK